MNTMKVAFSRCQTPCRINRSWQVVTLILSLIAIPVGASAQSGLTLGEDPPPQPSDSVIDLGPAKKPVNPPKAAKPKPQAPATGLGDSASRPDAEGDPVITRYGDWEVACAQSGSPCIMAQIGNDSKGTPILEMSLRKLPATQSVQGVEVVAVTDIITPLAVVLTAGLVMRIDSSDEQRAPYQICTAQGCLVREPLTVEAVNRFKKGGKAKLTVVSAEQGPVDVTISLTGFTKAYQNIK